MRPKGIQLLGPGQARHFKARPDHTLVESGSKVYEVPNDFFCSECEGTGCRSCKFHGESFKYSDTFVEPRFRNKKELRTLVHAIVTNSVTKGLIKPHTLPGENWEECLIRLIQSSRIKMEVKRFCESMG